MRQESEFRAPVDLVVDDASHLYEQTKTAFEEQRGISGNNSEISAAEHRGNSSGNSDKKATISAPTARNIPTP